MASEVFASFANPLRTLRSKTWSQPGVKQDLQPQSAQRTHKGREADEYAQPEYYA